MQLTFHRDVAADIIRTIAHYEDLGGASLASEFQAEVRATFLKALEAPRSKRILKRDLRRVDLLRFPYHFPFRIVGNDLRVPVVRHHSRNLPSEHSAADIQAHGRNLFDCGPLGRQIACGDEAMATVVHEHLDVVPVSGFKISWGGIWAGVLTVMGTLLFLTTLGLAIGIAAVNPGQTQAGTFGTGAAIWSGLSLLIALFVGGMAATRLGMVFDRAAGAFEGALVWVLSFLVVLWLASSGVQLVANGISSLFGGIGQTIGATVGDLSAGDVQQIRQRLNDPRTASALAAATGMPEQEVRSRLAEVSRQVDAARDNPEAAVAAVRQGTAEMMDRARAQLPAMAERAQKGATKAAWITFTAMLISLIAAVAGAMVGRKRVVQTLAHSNIPSEISGAGAPRGAPNDWRQ